MSRVLGFGITELRQSAAQRRATERSERGRGSMVFSLSHLHTHTHTNTPCDLCLPSWVLLLASSPLWSCL